MCDMPEREIQEDWVERGRSKLAGTLKKKWIEEGTENSHEKLL